MARHFAAALAPVAPTCLHLLSRHGLLLQALLSLRCWGATQGPGFTVHILLSRDPLRQAHGGRLPGVSPAARRRQPLLALAPRTRSSVVTAASYRAAGCLNPLWCFVSALGLACPSSFTFFLVPSLD